MRVKEIYTLRQAQSETGESRHLINFLVRDRQIPILNIGMAKVLDADGLRMLRESIRDYRSKTANTVAS